MNKFTKYNNKSRGNLRPKDDSTSKIKRCTSYSSRNKMISYNNKGLMLLELTNSINVEPNGNNNNT